MKPRYFHLYADYKTVKEIDYATYIHVPKNRLVLSVYKEGIYLRKGNSCIYLPIVQLKQVLGEG